MVFASCEVYPKRCSTSPNSCTSFTTSIGGSTYGCGGGADELRGGAFFTKKVCYDEPTLAPIGVAVSGSPVCTTTKTMGAGKAGQVGAICIFTGSVCPI